MELKSRKTLNRNLPKIHDYAEVWLNEAVKLLRPLFAEMGYDVPPVHVSVGFSTDGYKPHAKKNTIGVCHARCMTVDGINEIYITPLVTEPLDVLGILVHELIHAVDDCKSGHGPGFQKISREMKCGDNLKVPIREWFETVERHRVIACELGRYPRAGVRYSKSFDV
jgi:hypothetical protein